MIKVLPFILFFCVGFANSITFAASLSCKASATQHILKNEKGPFENHSFKNIQFTYLRYLQNTLRNEQTYRLFGASQKEALGKGDLALIQDALFQATGSPYTLRVLNGQGRSKIIEVKDIVLIRDVIELLQAVTKDSPKPHENFELVAYATNQAKVRYFIRLSSFRYIDDFGFPQTQEIAPVLKMETRESETLYYMGTLGRTHGQGHAFPSQSEIKNQRDNYRVKQRFSMIISPGKERYNLFDANTQRLINDEIMDQGIGSLWDRAVTYRIQF